MSGETARIVLYDDHREARDPTRHGPELLDALDRQGWQGALSSAGHRLGEAAAQLRGLAARAVRFGLGLPSSGASSAALALCGARTPRPSRAGKYRSKRASKLRPVHLPLEQGGGVRGADRLPVVHGRSDIAATESRSSASDTGRPAARSASTKSTMAGDQRAAGAGRVLEAQLLDRALVSEACLSTTPRVRTTVFSSRSPTSSAMRVRAQSTDSAIEGAFCSSSSRSRATVSTSRSAIRWSRSGTWPVTISRSRSTSG